MLRFLHIRNIAVIEDLEVEFGPGLNVITGETGSGKSIVIDAVGLLAGARASAELIRTGEAKATVEGHFEVPAGSPVWGILREQGLDGIDPADGLLIRRELSASGSGRCAVGGQLVTSAFLRRLGENLVEIHGQHDTRLLLQPRYHLDLLDALHGQGGLVREVAELSRRIGAAREERERLVREEQTRLQRLDLLNFQVADIEAAGLRDREEEKLHEERQILSNAEKLYQAANDGYAALYENEGAVLGELGKLAQRLEEAAAIDPRLARPAEALQACRFQIEDAAFTLRDYAGAIEYDERRLDEIENRLLSLDRLKRKYGASVDQVLEYLRQIRAERDQLLKSDERKASLEKDLAALAGEYRRKAEELSAKRREAAAAVEKGMVRHLGELAMTGTRFRVDLRPANGGDACPPAGLDAAEFLASPNVGEDLRPLQKIASGGELSRMTLALKLILKSEPDATLIFDEIDAGIGGGTAEVVGQKLRRAAAANQTFCVTHVPQIAALADHHYRVEKKVAKGRTATRIQRLDDEPRVEELARMLGGVKLTDITRRHARELLEKR